MFQLEENVVHSIISKLIINDELLASWDQPSGSLLFHSVDPNPLQLQALNFSDKIIVLLDNAENSGEQRGYERREVRTTGTAGAPPTTTAQAPVSGVAKKPMGAGPLSVGQKTPVAAAATTTKAAQGVFMMKERRGKKTTAVFATNKK